MALSGSKSVTVTAYNKLIFSWSATQSVSGNYSDISWSMVLKSTKYGAISSSAPKSWSVWIGNNHYTGSNTVGIGANSSKTLASGKTRVTHSSAGEASFSYSFSQTFNINFNGWVGTKSGSGSATLNTIPRASSLTIPAMTFGKAGTLGISRASSGFTHTVIVSLGSSFSQTIATKTTATSLSFTPPLDWARGIPSSQSGTLGYTIYTYSGSTLIGSKTQTGSVKILGEDAFPMHEGVDILDANSEIVTKFGEFVQGKSIVQADGSYHGQYGATIKQTFVEVEGKRYTSTTDISQATVPIAGSGALSIGYGCVDSRGFENKQTRTIQVTPYTAPTLTEFSAFRCNASGVAEDEGARLNCRRIFSISPISNKNTNTWKIEARKSGDTSWTQIANGTGYTIDDNYITSDFFDVDYPYEVQLTISDYFTTISKIIEISTAFTLVDYHNSGHGIAFGKVATEQNLFDVDFPSLFRQGTREILPVHRSANFDDFVETGKYYITSNVGGVTTKAGWLEVFAHPYDSNYCYQRFTTYDGEKFERMKNNGIWEQWCGTFTKTGTYEYTTYMNGRIEYRGYYEWTPTTSSYYVYTDISSTMYYLPCSLPIINTDLFKTVYYSIVVCRRAGENVGWAATVPIPDGKNLRVIIVRNNNTGVVGIEYYIVGRWK